MASRPKKPSATSKAKKPVRGASRKVPRGTRAIVLAGGKGTRLRPYTTLLPKPLVPIGERPILEYVLRSLRKSGFRRVTLCVGHLAELIRAYFGDGRKWGVELDYLVETKPLSTMGPLAYAGELGENFLVMNGDILTDLDPADVFNAHRKAGAALTVATYARRLKVDYGVLDFDANTQRVTRFTEKPTLPYHVSMGIYALNAECLEFIRKGRPYGFDQLMHRLLKEGRPVQSLPYEGRWLDVGRPEDYELAQNWEGEKDS